MAFGETRFSPHDTSSHEIFAEEEEEEEEYVGSRSGYILRIGYFIYPDETKTSIFLAHKLSP